MEDILREIYLNYHHTYPLKENIRFELAWGKEGNYTSRIKNAKKRGKVLFDEVFNNSDKIQMIFFISKYSSKNKIEKFLLKNKFAIIDSFVTGTWDWEDDEFRTTVLVIETDKENFRALKVIDAICYQDFYEYGKLRIKSPFVFYNSDTKTILNIYDDRGCDVWSDNIQEQKRIYKKYNDWILDYDRENISNFYESIK